MDDVLLFYDMGSLGASGKARSAPNAFIGIEKKLGTAFLRFRIMAPHTFKGTALEKHRGSYSVSVVYRKAFYFKYFRFHNIPSCDNVFTAYNHTKLSACFIKPSCSSLFMLFQSTFHPHTLICKS